MLYEPPGQSTYSPTKFISLPFWQSGFSLIELLMSMLIFSVGVLGLASMQITSMRMTLDSQLNFKASLLAKAISSQLEVTGVPSNLQFWEGQVKENLPSGLVFVESNASGYQVRLSWYSSEDQAKQQGARRSEFISRVVL